MGVNYSIYVVKDRYNSYNVPSILAITEECVYLTNNKKTANEVFEDYKKMLTISKKTMEKKEIRQYLYMIKDDSNKKLSYTVKRFGYNNTSNNNKKNY